MDKPFQVDGQNNILNVKNQIAMILYVTRNYGKCNLI